jgi:hypothetical protein
LAAATLPTGLASKSLNRFSFDGCHQNLEKRLTLILAPFFLLDQQEKTAAAADAATASEVVRRLASCGGRERTPVEKKRKSFDGSEWKGEKGGLQQRHFCVLCSRETSSDESVKRCEGSRKENVEKETRTNVRRRWKTQPRLNWNAFLLTCHVF